MIESCQLEVGPHFQCCCNCKHHWQDFHHCHTAPVLRDAEEKCVCSVPKGYACVVFKVMEPKNGAIHSGWPEHSIGCEMYSAIKN